MTTTTRDYGTSFEGPSQQLFVTNPDPTSPVSSNEGGTAYDTSPPTSPEEDLAERLALLSISPAVRCKREEEPDTPYRSGSPVRKESPRQAKEEVNEAIDDPLVAASSYSSPTKQRAPAYDPSPLTCAESEDRQKSSPLLAGEKLDQDVFFTPDGSPAREQHPSTPASEKDAQPSTPSPSYLRLLPNDDVHRGKHCAPSKEMQAVMDKRDGLALENMRLQNLLKYAVVRQALLRRKNVKIENLLKCAVVRQALLRRKYNKDYDWFSLEFDIMDKENDNFKNLLVRSRDSLVSKQSTIRRLEGLVRQYEVIANQSSGALARAGRLLERMEAENVAWRQEVERLEMINKGYLIVVLRTLAAVFYCFYILDTRLDYFGLGRMLGRASRITCKFS